MRLLFQITFHFLQANCIISYLVICCLLSCQVCSFCSTATVTCCLRPTFVLLGLACSLWYLLILSFTLLWAIHWQLCLNPSKCEALLISKKRNPVKASYVLDEYFIPCIIGNLLFGILKFSTVMVRSLQNHCSLGY